MLSWRRPVPGSPDNGDGPSRCAPVAADALCDKLTIRRRRCGVVKKIKYLAPVVENHSASVSSVATLETTNQDSDIVEDRPIEEPARRKKMGFIIRRKQTEENTYTTNDSDVFDDIIPSYNSINRVAEDSAALKENTYINPPANTEKRQIKKKRICSLKDDYKNNEIPRSSKERRPSTSTHTPIATCYKELKKACKSRIRLRRKRVNTQCVISPKTRKFSDVSNKIKDNVVNGEKIIFFNRTSEKDLYLFNMSSERDDEPFKKKKIQAQKHIGSSSMESVKRHRRSMKPVNYTEYCSSEDECQKVSKSKPNLTDETNQQPEKDTNISEESESAPQQSVIETIIPDDSIDEPRLEKYIGSSSLESVKRHRRSMKPVNYTEYYSSEDECQNVSKSKPNLTDETNQQPEKDTNISEESESAPQQSVIETIIPDDSIDEPRLEKHIGSLSLESVKRPRRSMKPVNYTEYYSSEDECQKVSKSKPNLTDETNQQPETDTNISEELESAPQKSVIETIIPDDSIGEPRLSVNKPQRPSKLEIIKIKTKKGLKNKLETLTKPTITNMSKEIVNSVATDRESATVGPMPGLVAEMEPRITDDLTQNLIKIYSDIDDLSTNLLVNNYNNGLEVDILSDTGDHQNLSMNMGNYNDNAVAPEDFHTVDTSDVASEKSISTGGRSPITAHNNSDESPPNLDAIYESFEHRDLYVEGKSISISEFLENMRNSAMNSEATVNNTSSVIPISRMPTKICERSNLCMKKIPEESNLESFDYSSNSGSVKSDPRITLKTMSSEGTKSLRNPVTTYSKVLNRITSKELRKIVKVTRIQKSDTNRSSVPFVVLDRISFDEINKWLSKPRTAKIEEPKNTRKISMRRKSVSKPCIKCTNYEPQKIVNRTGPKITRSQTGSIKSTQSRTIVGSVQNWIERNAALTQTDNNTATKEMLFQEDMEKLEIQLAEINEVFDKVMQVAFLMDYKELSSVLQEVDRIKTSLEAPQTSIDTQHTSIGALHKSIAAHQTSKMRRTCALLHAHADSKAKMVVSLKEGMRRLFK